MRKLPFIFLSEVLDEGLDEGALEIEVSGSDFVAALAIRVLRLPHSSRTFDTDNLALVVILPILQQQHNHSLEIRHWTICV